MTLIDASIRAVVDHHFCSAPLDVRYKWRRAMAEAVEHRTNIVGHDSKPINDDPRMCFLMKKLNEHLHAEIRREAKITPNNYKYNFG